VRRIKLNQSELEFGAKRLDLGVDFKSRLKSTLEFGVGSGPVVFTWGPSRIFMGSFVFFQVDFFNITLFFATLRARLQMNESLFCVRVTASVRRTTWIKTTKYQY